VDILRVGRIVKGLPGAWKEPEKPKPTPDPRALGGVESVIRTISPDALTPADKRKGKAAMEYADAQMVARDLARMLNEARRQGRSSVDFELGANYASVPDRAAILAELTRIVALVRSKLPPGAAGIGVRILFGGKFVKEIALARAE